jgi:hypothetical protein
MDLAIPYGMLKNPTSIKKKVVHRQNSAATSRQVCPVSLLDVSAGICQTAVVDETLMIRSLVRTYNRSEMVAVQGSPCALTPHQ